MTQIKELTDGMKRIDVEGQIVDIGDPREVKSRFKDETYRIADAVLSDETASIKVTLWNEQIDAVQVGDMIKVSNGYVTSFRSELSLNVGKFGSMTKI